MIRYIFVAFIFLIMALAGHSQTLKIKPVQRHKLVAPTIYPMIKTDSFRIFPERNFKKFTMKDGLAQMNVKKIFIDSRGRMWIGTYGGGANIYDGKSFITINKKNGLPNNNVFNFAEDKEGNIWMSTDRGVVYYDGAKIHIPSKDTALTQKEVWYVFVDSKNRKWFGSARHGVYMLDGKKLKIFNMKKNSIPDDRITCFAEDKSGNIFIGTWGSGIIKYDGKELISYKQNDKSLDMIRDLSTDAEGKIWCATAGGIIVLSKGKSKILTTDDGLPTNSIYQIYHVAKNQMWIATGSGICFHNEQSFDVITTDRGLPDNRTNTILQDKWGTVWTGTSGSGLVKLLNQPFYHFTKEGGLPTDHPSFVFKDSKNNIWLASDDKGLFKFNWSYWEHFSPENGFKWSGISCMIEDSDGNIWFGTTNSGAVKFDHHQFYEYGNKQNISNLRVWSITEDKNKDIWLGTNWSAYRITDDSVFVYNNNNKMLPYYLIISVFRDSKDNLWFGTFGGGIAVVNTNKNIHFSTDNGLLNNAVFSFAEDKFGNIWISNYGEGVMVLKDGTTIQSNKTDLKYFNTSNVLQTDVVSFVKSDKEGNIWLGSAQGITKVVLKKDVFISEPEFTHYGYEDGFIGEECRLNGFAEDEAGTLWIPSNKKLTLFLQEKLKVDKIPPMISFTSLKLDLKEINWSEKEGVGFSGINKWNNIPEDLALEYYNNHLQFEFIGISFDRPEAVEYQWKLTGLKDEWSPWSKQRIVSLSNLDPGEYTFVVRSRNGDKIISEELTYRFEIYPPFWKTWWFRTLAGFLILLSVYGVYRWRTLALRNRQAELEQTVQIRTVEVVKQKHLVEEKQKEILDSINYAKRIQYTLLANDHTLKKNLKDYFVMFKPKDIVSGDFYWCTKNQHGFYLAVCDCTGHGVPGAFMSLLNISFLNEAINEKNIKEPHLVLNFVRDRLIQNMEGAQDGMDAVLIRFTGDKIDYGAAHNRPVLVSAGVMKELSADKMPVGKGERQDSFTLHEIEIKKGDSLYLYTDGYADQFGGEKGKKFKYANLNRILAETHSKNPEIQKSELEITFEKWRGDLEQVDDVCIIGIRF